MLVSSLEIEISFYSERQKFLLFISNVMFRPSKLGPTIKTEL